jgi:hypothetical protein
MEALRKEVRATRERVKALEAEVRGQKGQGATLNDVYRDYNDLYRRQRVIYDQVVPDGSTASPVGRPSEPTVQTGSKVRHDAFAEAEAALRKLRQNPSDKQAAEALEKATQRIKARTKGESKSKSPDGY